jgi:hypothetical protein
MNNLKNKFICFSSNHIIDKSEIETREKKMKYCPQRFVFVSLRITYSYKTGNVFLFNICYDIDASCGIV